MRRIRKGTSVAELLVVMIIIGVLAGAAVPRVKNMRRQANLSGARAQMTSYLNVARQAALRRGRTAVFYNRGGWIWVTVDSAGKQVILRPKVNIGEQFKMKINRKRNPEKDSIVYNPRGMAMSEQEMVVFAIVSEGNRADSVCVTRLGALLPSGCTP